MAYRLRPWKNLLIALGISLSVLVLAFFITFAMQLRAFLSTPLTLPQGGRVVSIASGLAAPEVAERLAMRGVVADQHLFYLVLRFSGKARSIKAGDYFFAKQVTPLQVLDKLVRGDVLPREFTIVPGWRVRDVLKALQSFKGALDLRGLPPPEAAQDLLARMQVSADPAEGWLLPESYRFEVGTRALDLLARAHQQMRQVLEQAWAERDVGLPLQTPYQALVLASIVEKETGKAEERPLVAAVFINRLRTGMRLQADPTVIYGLGETYTGDITDANLRQPTPYNTYTQSGLPPTPIANPSREAIHAVLHPAPSKALYFVASGDGGHVFSVDYDSHRAAVRRLLSLQKQ